VERIQRLVRILLRQVAVAVAAITTAQRLEPQQLVEDRAVAHPKFQAIRLEVQLQQLFLRPSQLRQIMEIQVEVA